MLLLLVACAPSPIGIPPESRRSSATTAEETLTRVIDNAITRKVKASDAAATDQFGYAVSAAGDVDDDGYDDLLVGAYADDDQGDGSGSAYVYLGSGIGVDRHQEQKILATDGAAGDLFGGAVSAAGDVDGDGYDDVVVGARGDDDVASGSGAVYVYYGIATGIDPSRESKLVWPSGAADDQLGISVAAAGDVDGDGYADIVAGASRPSGIGVAVVYFGGAAGMDSADHQVVQASDGAVGDEFGLDVGGAGDVDGDGYTDLVVGAWADDDDGTSSGSAYVDYGAAVGVDVGREDKLTATTAAGADYFGTSVAGAGDVNADGYDEIVVGAWGRGSSGSAFVYAGSPSGVGAEAELSSGSWGSGDYVGRDVAAAGDVDGDGYADVLLGACNHSDYFQGAAFLHPGGPAGIDAGRTVLITGPATRDYEYFGWAVAGAMDVNADGYDDVGIGAWGDDDDGDASGSVSMYHGCVDVDHDGACDDAACPDNDRDGSCDDADCDDANRRTFPGAVEVCNTIDDDCDGSVDEGGRVVAFRDADGDGFGNSTFRIVQCVLFPGWSTTAGDCDDTDPAIGLCP